MVPDDGSKTEYLTANSRYTRVDITVRRAPEARDLTVGEVVDDLDCPSELSNEFEVGQCCHVRVRVCMHGDVVTEVIVCSVEDLVVVENVDTDHEVGCTLVVLLQVLVKRRRCLYFREIK